MANNIQLKKIFLRILIGSLSASALVGIIIFLLGKFGDIEEKILATTLVIGACSLLGLCNTSIFQKEKVRWLGVTGVALSVTALIYSLALIWVHNDSRVVMRIFASLIIWTVTVSHICLLLLINCADSIVKKVLNAAIVFILTVSVMLSIIVWADKITNDFYFRLLGVFAILDVLGTIVTPILNKVQSVKHH